jgi:hypothetical protein
MLENGIVGKLLTNLNSIDHDIIESALVLIGRITNPLDIDPTIRKQLLEIDNLPTLFEMLKREKEGMRFYAAQIIRNLYFNDAYA